MNYKCEGQISIFDIIKPTQAVDFVNVGYGVLFRYLRYGPHTLVPEAAKKCKQYLDAVQGIIPAGRDYELYGFSKGWSRPPCMNCEHFINGCCHADAHTAHFEYEKYLVCDAFKQTITAKPKCEYSGHVCNRENVWEVADTLDLQTSCPHTCCRNCDNKLCGARCNGADTYDMKGK